jgi:hypothetical protein
VTVRLKDAVDVKPTVIDTSAVRESENVTGSRLIPAVRIESVDESVNEMLGLWCVMEFVSDDTDLVDVPE